MTSSCNATLVERLRDAARMSDYNMGDSQWLSDLLVEAASALSSERGTRAFEEQPFAWAVKLASGVESLVYHPIEGNLELRPGDVAYPLFREVYTKEQLDAAAAEAKRLTKRLEII